MHARDNYRLFLCHIYALDCHKQIEEKWRQKIIVVGEHEFSSMEEIDLEDV